MSRQEEVQAADTAASSAPRPALSPLPVIVLVTICVVAGALLGAVHAMTEPVIQAAAEERAQETYAQLVPEATSFQEVACDVADCTAAMEAQDVAGSTIAYVIVAEAKGYGGDVPIAVAFDLDGTVKNVTVMANSETPGLGSRIAEETYLGQYRGLSAQVLDAESVDLISGATISSKAAVAAFNVAVEAYEEVR